MALAVVVATRWGASRIGVRSVGSVGVVGLGRRERRMLGREIRLGIGVFGGCCVVWTTA